MILYTFIGIISMQNLLLIFRFLIRPTLYTSDLTDTSVSFKWVLIIILALLEAISTAGTFLDTSFPIIIYEIIVWSSFSFGVIVWSCMRLWRARTTFFDTLFLISCASLLFLPITLLAYFPDPLVQLLYHYLPSLQIIINFIVFIIMVVFMYFYIRICTISLSITSGLSKKKTFVSFLLATVLCSILEFIFMPLS